MSQQSEASPSVLSGYRYEPRSIRFLGVSTLLAGWSVKSYAITVAGHDPALPEVGVAAAWHTLSEMLPLASAGHESHGVAIQTMHLGLKGFWVLVDWWAYGDVLMHRHLHAPVTDPGALQDMSAEGFGPCVWELAVQAHERRAWLEHMLARPQRPDLQAYLEDGLTAVV